VGRTVVLAEREADVTVVFEGVGQHVVLAFDDPVADDVLAVTDGAQLDEMLNTASVGDDKDGLMLAAGVKMVVWVVVKAADALGEKAMLKDPVVLGVSLADSVRDKVDDRVGGIVEVLVGLTERLFEALTDTGGDADPLADLVRDIVGDIVGDMVAVPVWLHDLLFEAVFDTVALTEPLTLLLEEAVHDGVRD
jgi:hypothetical protein